MSIDTLRARVAGAGGAPIGVNSALFTAAGLAAPPGLDALIGKTFSDADPAQGLMLRLAPVDVSPVSSGHFIASGTINTSITGTRPVEVRFGATDNQGTLVIAVDLGDGWRLPQSFPSLSGKIFTPLGLFDAWFFFAAQPEAQYPWSGATVELVPGLNLAANLVFDGHLGAVAEVLGLSPRPSYALVGTIDPTREVRTTSKGKRYGLPGLDLRSAPLAPGTFKLGHITIGAPFLWITTVPGGGGARSVTAMTLAAPLGGSTGPIFRAVLSAVTDVKLLAFDVLPDASGFVLAADQLSALMGSSELSQLVPPALTSLLEGFGVVHFGATINYERGLRISQLHTEVSAGRPWVVLDDPLFSISFRVGWTLRAPFQTTQSQLATLSATARFMPELFPRQFDFTIDDDLVVTGGYTAQDPSEHVSLTELLLKVTGGAIAIPDRFISISLQEFFVRIDQPARTYQISTTTTAKLPILGEGALELDSVVLEIGVDRSSASGARYTAGITGDLVVGGLHLRVVGTYAAGLWKFALAMQPRTVLKLHGFFGAVLKGFDLPPDLFALGLSLSNASLTVVVPANKTQATTYTAGGTLAWHLDILGQTIDMSAELTLAYDAAAAPSRFTGSVKGTTTVDLFGFAASFVVGYALANDPTTGKASKTLSLTWEGLTTSYVQGAGQSLLTFTADATWNVANAIQRIARLADPNFDFQLDPPWDKLSSISLQGLAINVDLAAHTVSFEVHPTLSLDGLMHVDSVRVALAKGGTPRVAIAGSVLGTSFSPSWDVINQPPPALPSAAPRALDVRYLGLGQHVALTTTSDLTTVGKVIEALRNVPVAQDPTTSLHDLKFDASAGWLIGFDLSIKGAISVAAIFNDPVLYGLKISLSGDLVGKLKGLSFEILYRKIADGLGLYHIDLLLPLLMRHLQFGSVSLTLPHVIVDIYTNGNFLVDFGFPYERDFSRSMMIEVFPFVGAGGFYFGVLDSSTTNLVPTAQVGSFKPVIAFGLGLQVGLGKTFEAGPLSAGITITVEGLLEGVLAFWKNGDASETYYKLSGTVAISAHVWGSVDFVIVSASIDIYVFAAVQLVIESHEPIFLELSAGVSVSASARVCGLFTVHFHFSTTIHESFTIGSTSHAPWQLS